MDIRHPVAWLREQGKKVLEIQDSPHAIALGIAIGIFWGFTPMYGLKTILTLVSAVWLRANKIAAVVAVSLHDLLFPIFPVVFEIEYLIGKTVLESFGVIIHPQHLHGLHIKELMNWTTFVNLGEPLLIGTFIFGLATSPFFYFISLGIVKAAHLRRAQAAQ